MGREPAQPTLLLAQVAEMLAARTGLHYPEERWSDLERGIAAASADLGFLDAASCLRWLAAAPRSARDIETLVCHLTVGETYFFRDPPVFEAFETRILPALLRERSGDQWRLRIWSAGCCTGEEPYTIAMLLDRTLPPACRHNVTILATDINARFLRRAERGVYGEWAFRAAPAWVKERHFKPRRDGRYEIRDELRAMVTFSYLNLAEDSFPSLSGNTGAMDVIFCRNVLMYFSPACLRTVAGKLRRSLLDGGWLFVSPVEMSSAAFAGLEPVAFPGALAYRASRRGPVFEPVAAVPVVASPDVPVARPAVATAPDPERETPAVAARRCADEGSLEEALRWCDKAVAADSLDASNHYLRAMILRERGDLEAAAAALERALYLQPTFVLAHFALGNVRLAQRRGLEARRHLANALEFARRHRPGEMLEGSEGITAGRLADIIGALPLRLARSVPAPARP
jgi:chemotaxis protein methyltransferase CheR